MSIKLQPKPGILFVLLLFAGDRVLSQEMLGIMNSTYSGIHGAIINPALPVSSPYYLDINILSAHFFARNNYIYLAKDEYKFKRFFQTNPQFPTHPPDGKFYYDYYTPPNKTGYFNLRILGPSAALMIGRHAIGIYTDARSVTSFRNIPENLAKFFYEGLTYPPQYKIRYVETDKMASANLEWAELAVNYSYIFRNRNLNTWSIGATVKRLQGYAGAYAYADQLDYMVPEHDTLIVYHATGEGGLSLPLDYQTDSYMNSPLFRGKGWGFDIGFTYEKKLRVWGNSDNFGKLCSQSYEPYRFRIGVSLLDIGRIRFRDNAMKFQVADGSLNWPGISFVDYTNMNDIVGQVSSHFFANTTQLIVDREIIIGLPTALSVQSDINIMGNWYGNGTIVLPLKRLKASVVRPALIAFGPRFETSTLGFGVLASVYDWNRFHLGLNARFLGLFAGTEMIGSFFNFADFTGIDFYAGVKISFRKGHCRSITNVSCGNNEYEKFRKKRKKAGSLLFR